MTNDDDDSLAARPPYRSSDLGEWHLDAQCDQCHFPLRVVRFYDTSQAPRSINVCFTCPNCGASHTFEAHL